jgi:uncharacterized protein (DUF58 family)
MKSRSRFKPPPSLRATRAGWCFIAIIFGVGFAAMNTGNNLLYLVLAVMLAFLVLSGLLSEASLRGIRIDRKLSGEFFARSTNRVILRIHNSQKHVASFAISIEDLLDAEPGQNAAGRSFALRVGPRAHVDRSYGWVPQSRGEHKFDRLRVSTRFPFGLFVKSVEIDGADSVLVYPELAKAASLDLSTTTGDSEEELRGRALNGTEIASLREFIPGDGYGRVHWRRSLRAGRLLVGEREGEASREIEVFLSLVSDAPSAAHELRIDEAASAIVHHLDAGLRVGLRSAEVLIPPGTGPAHRSEMLIYLARVDSDLLLHKANSALEREQFPGHSSSGTSRYTSAVGATR